MSIRSEQTIRDILDARLNTQPQTRRLYFTDAMFRSAVDQVRTGLVTVADVMDRRGLGWAVRDVLTDDRHSAT